MIASHSPVCTQVPPLAPRQLRVLGHVAEEQHPDNELPDQDSVVQVCFYQALLERMSGLLPCFLPGTSFRLKG